MNLNLNTLRTFKANYGNAINSIWRTFNNNLSNAYPKIKEDLSAYSKIFETFKAKAEINVQRFNDKMSHPDTTVELEDLSNIITELNGMIDAMNSKIRENNDIVNDRTKKQPQCKSDVIRHLAAVLEADIQHFRDSRSNLQKEIDVLTHEISQAKAQIKTLRSKISDFPHLQQEFSNVSN